MMQRRICIGSVAFIFLSLRASEARSICIARRWRAPGADALTAKGFAKHLIATAAADASMGSIPEGVEDPRLSKSA